MTLSIIIVSFNTRLVLENCLESLDAGSIATPHDITVVDNASADGSAEAIRGRWPYVRVLAQPRNLGFAAANNVGIRATRGDLVLLLNSDTVVPTGAVDALVGRLLAHPGAAVAGPRLVDAAGRTEISFGRMIGPAAEARQKVLGALHARHSPYAARWVARATANEQYVDWVSGACLLVHRAEAEAVGLLDERYFFYTEDVDFCAAVRARGRKVLYTPLVQITHLRGRSRAAAPDQSRAAYRRSHLAFYEKHHPRWAPVLRAYLRIKGELPDATDPAGEG
jgi:GT2 family glycosyltransferase